MGRKNATEYINIRKRILDMLMSDFGAPRRLPPLRELAKTFGVTAPTVMRAVNALAVDGYLIHCKGGGMVSNRVYEKMRNIKLFGIVNGLGNPIYDIDYFLQVNAALSLELVSRSRMNYCTANLYMENPERLSALVRENNLAGLILVGAAPSIVKEAEKLHENGLPAIGLFINSETISSNRFDETSACVEYELILNTLMRRRCKTILFCESVDEAYWNMLKKIIARWNAHKKNPLRIVYRQMLKFKPEEMVDLSPDAIVFGTFPLEEIRERLLNFFPPEKCIYVANQFIADKDWPFAGYVVDYRLNEYAELLTDHLLDQFHGPLPPVKYLLPPKMKPYQQGKEIG